MQIFGFKHPSNDFGKNIKNTLTLPSGCHLFIQSSSILPGATASQREKSFVGIKLPNFNEGKHWQFAISIVTIKVEGKPG